MLILWPRPLATVATLATALLEARLLSAKVAGVAEVRLLPSPRYHDEHCARTGCDRCCGGGRVFAAFRRRAGRPAGCRDRRHAAGALDRVPRPCATRHLGELCDRCRARQGVPRPGRGAGRQGLAARDRPRQVDRLPDRLHTRGRHLVRGRLGRQLGRPGPDRGGQSAAPPQRDPAGAARPVRARHGGAGGRAAARARRPRPSSRAPIAAPAGRSPRATGERKSAAPCRAIGIPIRLTTSIRSFTLPTW